MSSSRHRAKAGIRYVGGVGTYDVFWVGEYRRLMVKWVNVPGSIVTVTQYESVELSPLAEVNLRLEKRQGPKMTQEEYEVVGLMYKLFVPEAHADASAPP